jgi:hypothetical protein
VSAPHTREAAVPNRAVHVLIVTATAMTAMTAPAAAADVPTSAAFTEDSVRIRSAPALDARVNGQGHRGHRVTVWCEIPGDPIDRNYTWFWLTDHTTGVEGYSWSGKVTISDIPPAC